jgi:26S proteasome non-ATPase regulatory subunit 9
MGFILPAPYSPREQARALISRKEGIEAELDAQASILRANNATLQSPLVDNEGFPRDDLGVENSLLDRFFGTSHFNTDIYQVRNARVRIIELRNDLKAVTDDIAKALESIYDPSVASASSSSGAEAQASTEEDTTKPFARVDGVAPSSPAAEAVSVQILDVFNFPHN